MIRIGHPYLEEKSGLYWINCIIRENEECKQVFWGGVQSEYAKYLLTERADAFLVGLLSYAMRTGNDIECEAPISEELLYNIRQYLIPLVIKYGNNLHYVNIIADTVSEPLENAGMVGASASCGVDSFNTIVNQYSSPYKSMNITHLCLNDVGAFNTCYGDEEECDSVKKIRYKKSAQFADEIGLPLILTESNFGQMFKQNHLYTNTYSSVFSILCMRKAWKTYFYSSAYHDIGMFSLFNNESRDSSYYDLLSLNCFSTDGLRIYSEGGERTRLGKVFNIADFSYAKKYLHVCIRKEYNCGMCDKCARTLLCLDIAGKLDDFSEVFDIVYYKKHRIEYLKWFILQYRKNKLENQDMYDALSDDSQMVHLLKEDLPKEYQETKQLLETHKIILYGYSDLGRKIEAKYGKNIEIKIDNKIKGEKIVTFEEFKNKFLNVDKEDYVCSIASFSKYRQLQEQMLKHYPGLKILNPYIVEEIINEADL